MSEITEILRPPFSKKLETQALIKRFEALAETEPLNYKAVEEIIKINPQSETGRGITTSARKTVQRESSIVIECVRAIGFKRATDPEKVHIAGSHIGKIRRTVRRGAKVLKATDRSRLNGDQQTTMSLNTAVLRAIDQATKPKVLKEVEKSIDASSDIKFGDVLRLCLPKENGEKKD